MTVSKVYTSAPEIGTRSKEEEETFALLDKLGIEYQWVDHEPAMTIEACRDIDRILDTHLCKNLFLTNSAKTDYYLLLLPGEKAFHTREVADQIGSTRLSFAGADKMLELLRLTPGSVTVMGLMYDRAHKVKLLIDRDLANNEYICFHPCRNTCSVKAKTDRILGDFLSYTGHIPTYVTIK